MPLELTKALGKLGLGDKEVKVLSTLLEGGQKYAAAIARDAKLNRTTTYGILKELTAKGLVTAEQRTGAARYQSIAPELLPAYIERRGKDLLETKEEVAKLIPQIKLMRSKASALPKVQFFDGEEGMKQAYEDKVANNAGKKLYEFTGMDAGYAKLDRAFIEYYLKRRKDTGVRSEYIAPDTPFAREQARNDKRLMRRVTFIPPEFAMNTEISIYDNKVSMTSFSADNPITVLIEDESIASAMKKIFDYVQSTAK